MEETFSLITGRAGLMCTGPMALVTQCWEHTKGLSGGLQSMTYSCRFLRMQLMQSNLCVQSAGQDTRVQLCSMGKQFTVPVQWT